MNTKNLSFLLLFFCALLFQSCIKKGCTDDHANNFVKSATEDDGTCTYDEPSGTITTEMGEDCAFQTNAIDFSEGTLGCETCNDDTTQYSADIYFDGENFRVAKADSCTGSSQLQIANTGDIAGLGAIYELPSSGFTASQVTAKGWGFVVRTREGKYARIFIDDYVYDANDIVVGVRIKWQYPMPI